MLIILLKISKVSQKCQGLIMDLGTIDFDIQVQVAISQNE